MRETVALEEGGNIDLREDERERRGGEWDERNMAWKWRGNEGGLEWRREEREEMEAKGRGER